MAADRLDDLKREIKEISYLLEEVPLHYSRNQSKTV